MTITITKIETDDVALALQLVGVTPSAAPVHAAPPPTVTRGVEPVAVIPAPAAPKPHPWRKPNKPAADDAGPGNPVAVWVEESGKELTSAQIATMIDKPRHYVSTKIWATKKAGQREFLAGGKTFRLISGAE